MKHISLVFLLITISACVFFSTQSDRRKRTDHTEKSGYQRADNGRQVATERKMKKASLDTGQQNGVERQRQRSMVDQHRDVESEKRDAKSIIRVRYTKPQKYAEGRYINTSRAVNKKTSEMFKEDRDANSIVTEGDRKNTEDDEGRYLQTKRTENNKILVNGQEKETFKGDMHVNSNMTTSNKMRGHRQKELNKLDKYLQSNAAVDIRKKTRNDHQKEVNKVGKYIHELKTVMKDEELKNHKFEFRNAADTIKQQNVHFGLDDHYEHDFLYHHTKQKRDVDRQTRFNQGANDEQNKLNQEACSLGESDVEKNCESLFQCCQNENKTNPNCYCDDLCPLFDDCCHDINTTSLNVSEKYRRLMARIQCQPLKRLVTASTYQVIATCPQTYTNNNVSQKCEKTFSAHFFDHHFNAPVNDPLLIVPVTDLLQVTYKNIFCAVCNDISDIRPWTMKYPIDMIETLNVSNIDEYTWEEFPYLQNYVMVFPPEDLPVRFCNGYARTNKQEEGQVVGNWSDANKCNSFRRFLNITSLYLEKSCLTAAWEYEYCYPDHVIYTNCSSCVLHEFSTDNARWRSHSMHVLFTFNMANDDCDTSYKISVSGDDDSLYICPKSTLLNPYYFLEYYFRFEGNLSQSTYDFLSTTLFSYFNAVTDSEAYLESYNRFVFQNKECNVQLIKMSLAHLTQTDYNSWDKVTRWYDDLNWTYTELHDSGKVVMSKVSSASIQNHTICDFTRFKIDISKMFIKENSAIFQYLPRTQRFCQNVNFTLEVKNPDALVFDQLNELRVRETDCKEVMDVYDNTQDNFDDALTIISSILMGTGCITLICSLISNVVLKADVSIPGLITRHMMITTLLFQVLFIVGIGATDNYVVCFAFGVALHYCTLCAFAWMSICAGHLAKSLIRIKKLPGNMHDRDRKFRYFLICFGYIIPTFIVIPSVTVDTCQCTPFTIDYGTGICFPNPRAYPESLLVFIGPISVHILFNIACLSVSIFQLSRAKVNVAVLRISRSYTPIYVKLCVYSGIGWVFGVATIVFPFDVIKLLFIVSCSSQGLFLSVITLCKLRVLRRLRTQLSDFKNGNRSSVE